MDAKIPDGGVEQDTTADAATDQAAEPKDGVEEDSLRWCACLIVFVI